MRRFLSRIALLSAVLAGVVSLTSAFAPFKLIDPPRDIEAQEMPAPVRWVALGDSITQGYYSTSDGTYHVRTSYSWARHAASALSFELDNRAKGGTGFVDLDSAASGINGRVIADSIDFGNYDLATVFYGTNDWKGYIKLGTFDDDIEKGGTIYSNMRYIIEKIQRDNPRCRIVVISPINCMAYSTYETDWALGCRIEKDLPTLAEVFEAEKEVSEYYGVEFIDMTYSSFINRDNIQNYLFDRVHPSIECHELLAKEIGEKLRVIMEK